MSAPITYLKVFSAPALFAVHESLATASRLAVLVDRYEAIEQDELIAAKDDYDLPRAVRLNREANAIHDELRETRLGYGWLRDGLTLVMLRELERRAREAKP